MRIHKLKGARTGSAALLVAALLVAPPAEAQSKFKLGRAATPAEIAAWNIDIAPDGKNLPPGSGTVTRGRDIFNTQCAACHGMKGEGGIAERLSGGRGTLGTPSPVFSVGSFWPYATTLFDYIRRAMPLNAPQSLPSDDVYSVAGYVLFLNDLMPETASVDAKVLTEFRMPNRDGFISDPRPDVKTTGCMKDCK